MSMSDADIVITNSSAGPPRSSFEGLISLDDAVPTLSPTPETIQPVDSKPPSSRPSLKAVTEVKPFRKGWAKGERSQFLDEAYHGYQSARTRGSHLVADYVNATVNAYCTRFTWWLDPPHIPTEDDLNKEDQDLSADLLSQKPARIKRISVGVKNYLEKAATHVAPISLMTSRQIEQDPIASLIATIGNAKCGLRRARTGYQLWSMDHFKSKVKKEVDDKVITSGLDAQKERITMVQHEIVSAYEALPAHIRQPYEDQSRREKDELKQRKQDNKWLPGRLSAEEVQLALDRLPHTLITLIDGLNALTGWNFDVFYSGPDPRAAGQITTQSVHSGSDLSPKPADFATAGGEEGLARRRLVEAAIGDFTMRCFDREARLAYCLPNTNLNMAPPNFLKWRPESWQNAMKMSPPTPPTVDNPKKRKKSAKAGGRSSKAAADSDSDSDNETTTITTPPRKKTTTHPSKSSLNDVNSSSKMPSGTKETAVLDDITNLLHGPSPLPPVFGPSDAPAGPVQESVSVLLSGGLVLPPFPDGTAVDEAQPLPPPVDDMDIDIDPTLLALDMDAAAMTATPPISQPSRRSTRVRSAPTTVQPSVHEEPPTLPVTKTVCPAPKVKFGKGKANPQDYMLNAQKLFAGLEGEPAWDDLVALYAKYESSRDYAKCNLATGRRPEALVRYVKSARVLPQDKVVPPLWPTDTKTTQQTFWQWWRWLQPDWRGVKTDKKNGDPNTDSLGSAARRAPPDDAEWQGLDASGVNGFLNVMSYMYFWGRQISLENKGQKQWMEAIEDVQWVLAAMCGDD